MTTTQKAKVLDLQPTLENAHIRIQPLTESQFDELYTVASDPLIWEQHPADRDNLEVFASYFKESIGSRGALAIIDKNTGMIIGSSRFKPVAGTETAVEIGWTFLARNYWGGEYNRMVKKLMIDHAFTSMDEVIFYVGPQNIRSQKAVEKIGGKRISEADYPELVRKGDVTYRIGREEWQP